MKNYLAVLIIIAFVQSVNGQQRESAHKPKPAKDKNCYYEYFDSFTARGALPVPDGEQNVVISLRTDTSCVCGQGKITVKDGRIVPSLMVKKVDGTYEEAKKELHPKMKKSGEEMANLYKIYAGMSQPFLTNDNYTVNLFFIDYLKRPVVANAPAPSPNDLPGAKLELSGKEKEIVEKAYEGLQFENGKSIIKPTSYPQLNNLATMLKEKKDYKLNIHGYTDNVGKAESNLALSKKRAESVKDYLLKQGLDAAHVSADGFGMDNPIGDNKTPEGRAKNRRVEFIVVQ